MQNKKFKNYHKDRLIFNVVSENFKMLCTILLALHELFPKNFYPATMKDWLDQYISTCNEMDEYERDGVFDYKMQQYCDEYGVDGDKCVAIVRKHLRRYNYQNTIVLADNVRLALVHTACNFGFGKQRIDKLIDYLLKNIKPNAVDEIKQYGIEYDFNIGQIDCDKFKCKKDKVSYTDGVRAKQALAALKAYQDDVIKRGVL